jgi:hypothetical protein
MLKPSIIPAIGIPYFDVIDTPSGTCGSVGASCTENIEACV